MAKVRLRSGPKIVCIRGHDPIAPGDVVDMSVLNRLGRSHFHRFVDVPPSKGTKAELIAYIEGVLDLSLDDVAALVDRELDSLSKLKVDELRGIIESAFA